MSIEAGDLGDAWQGRQRDESYPEGFETDGENNLLLTEKEKPEVSLGREENEWFSSMLYLLQGTVNLSMGFVWAHLKPMQKAMLEKEI